MTILKYMADAVRQPSRRPDQNMRDTVRREGGSRSRRLREKQSPITSRETRDLRAIYLVRPRPYMTLVSRSPAMKAE